MAYRAAAHITKERLMRDHPERARVLDEVVQSDVVVVAGQYDHVESVLRALEVPHTVVGTASVDRLDLRPEQQRPIRDIETGYLVSTACATGVRPALEAGGASSPPGLVLKDDWLEPAFPWLFALQHRLAAYDGCPASRC